jgi:hypothetical protein
MGQWRLYADLLFLRANPQDLPYSRALLAAALLAHVAADTLGALDWLPLGSALAAGVLDTLLLVAIVHTLLMLRNLGNRAAQTLSALALAGAIIGIGAWGITGLVSERAPAWLAWLPFLIWYLAVFAHVLRQALEIPYPAALALGVLYFVLSSGVTGAFFGVPAPVEP